MLAKENAYLLPVLLLLVELFLVRPARLKPVLPFGLLTMAVLIYRLAALGSIGGYVGDTGAPAVFDIGLQTIEGVLLRAPALSLLGLNWLQPGPVVPIAAFLAGLLLAIAFCSRLERHTRSVVTFGLGWILVAAAPAHPLLLIGPSLTNSRVLYLGTLGGAILVAALLTRLASRQIRNVATASVVILFVLGVGNNIAAWRYASDLSKQFLERTASAGACSRREHSICLLRSSLTTCAECFSSASPLLKPSGCTMNGTISQHIAPSWVKLRRT